MGKTRRTFSREFKLEAVKLVRNRGGSVAQATRDLGVHENMLRTWVRDWEGDPKDYFPGQGMQKRREAEHEEIDRLRREVAKLKAERDILTRPRPTSRRTSRDVRVHCEAL